MIKAINKTINTILITLFMYLSFIVFIIAWHTPSNHV